MPTVAPAIRSKMGEIEYYQTTMPAREFHKSVRAAQEVDDWANWGPEERLQRELNRRRVEKEIAPYLANFSDRFFGAFIVLVYDGEVHWEPLSDLGAKVPAAYRSEAKHMGFLVIDGGELIVLDGQHRNAALGMVIRREVDGPYAAEVANDQVSVIFIPFKDLQTTRRIFNKVNRHAKPTSRGDNLITSEDDGYAIVARRLFTEESAPLRVSKGELVEWKYNALADGSTKLTTINVLYETAKHILRTRDPSIEWSGQDVNARPEDEDLVNAFEFLSAFWMEALSRVRTWAKAVDDPSSIPKAREKKATTSLLHKPAAQTAMLMGVSKAVERGADRNMCFDRINEIDWSMENPDWEDILVSPNGRILVRKDALNISSDIIAYRIAPECMSAEAIETLRDNYHVYRGSEDWDLPKPVA